MATEAVVGTLRRFARYRDLQVKVGLIAIIAMLFVVFDVEVVFLYPWAVAFDELGLFGFLEMMLFIYFLVIGFVYAWRKGAFEWR